MYVVKKNGKYLTNVKGKVAERVQQVNAQGFSTLAGIKRSVINPYEVSEKYKVWVRQHWRFRGQQPTIVSNKLKKGYSIIAVRTGKIVAHG